MANLQTLLGQLYADDAAASLHQRIMARLATVNITSRRRASWGADDTVMITYADAFQSDTLVPLQALRQFLKQRLPEIKQVHLLPFFPYTSDDGFAVSNYRQVDETHGGWADVKALSRDVELIFDLVINHASSAHPRFLEFLSDEAPGNAYFLTANGDLNVDDVTRPRAHPLLQAYETEAGLQHVWCTFSRDQVDWDFKNPDVFYEFVDIFINYFERGATWIRLDAVAYLWKELGTNCIHRPETHAAVKILRWVAEQVSTDIKILTETNVPLAENLSYFGDGDEAHIVYNFTLPPLLIHALLTGRADYLSTWCSSLPPLPEGCTFLNFVASHDGIGLRPAEGILSESEVANLVACIRSFDGLVTERRRPDGTLSPYEANISLFAAFKGTMAGIDGHQVNRFLVSQGIMFALAGVPALYYNSVLASPNNLEGLAQTGRNRTINRRKWSLAEIDARLASESDPASSVLNGLREMLHIRQRQPAFHPEAEQLCLNLHSQVFALIRRCKEQRILCVFNLSTETVKFKMEDFSAEGAQTLYRYGNANCTAHKFSLGPYSMLWLSLA